MRQRYLLILLLASVAAADKKPAASIDPKAVIDVKPFLDKLEVYKDDYGKYLVVPRADATDDSEELGRWVFYGDQKAMYRQQIIGSGKSGSTLDWTVWAPRVRKMNQAQVVQDDKGASITCEYKDSKYVTQRLQQLPADQARTLLQHVALHPPLWQRQSLVLARDDEGVYYFVDRLRDDFGGHGERVFVGQKGAMKEMPMKNVVSDSAGQIFSTQNGELKLITDKQSQDHKAYWKKGGKKEDLTLLEPTENRYLIYSELGIYGSLGAVCDNN